MAIKISPKKPIQKTDASEIRALEEQLSQHEAELALLSDENKLLLKETEQRATELQIINNIGQTLTEGHDLNSMLERVAERLHKVLKVENIAIGVYDQTLGNVITQDYFYSTHASFAA